MSPEDRQPGIALLEALRTREVPERCRARIALDLLDDIVSSGGSISERSTESRLRLDRVRVDASGRPRLEGEGDGSGAQLLVWEIFAGRVATEPRPPRLRDVLDEIHTDVDELLGRAIDLECDAAELHDGLATALAGTTAPRGQVARAVGAEAATPARAPVAEPQPDVSAQQADAGRAAEKAAAKKAALEAALRRASEKAAAARAALEKAAAEKAAAEKAAAEKAAAGKAAAEKAAAEKAAAVRASSPAVAARPPPSARGSDGSVRPELIGAAVLLIHEDDPEARLLEQAFRTAGFVVTLCIDAAGGFETARALQPACIVCDFDLPDESGDDLLRRLRKAEGAVASTAAVLIARPADTHARLARFWKGADVCMLKPLRIADVVAQVGALVSMSVRLRDARVAAATLPPRTDALFDGDVKPNAIAAILTVLELEKRTGVFEVHTDDARATIDLVGGVIAGASSPTPGMEPLDVLRLMLAWRGGHFSFTPTPLRDPPADAPLLADLLAKATETAVEDEDLVIESVPPEPVTLPPLLRPAPPPPPPRPAASAPPTRSPPRPPPPPRPPGRGSGGPPKGG